MVFVNHVQKFKCPVKRMSYMKAGCQRLIPDAKRLIHWTVTIQISK